MIQVVFYRDSDRRYLGFQTRGHADYAESGSDIVCASVSALTLNTVNAIERLTSAEVSLEEADQDSGRIEFRITAATAESQLLFKALKCGLEDMEREYGDYIRVGYKEV